ncbi:hypothetical protein BDR06DRAFT_909770 [Suillus hirtellus]|nr:hypothetical protein BDR06DRAFT_909770 [Suillus hirtellus]
MFYARHSLTDRDLCKSRRPSMGYRTNSDSSNYMRIRGIHSMSHSTYIFYEVDHVSKDKEVAWTYLWHRNTLEVLAPVVR